MNLDLVAIEEVELSTEQRENLTKVAVENLHNSSINKFIEEQELFHNAESIFDLYSGMQQLSFPFTIPKYSLISSDVYPETFLHATVMSPAGAFEGSFSSLGWGQLVSKDNLYPSLKLNYTAYIDSRVLNTVQPQLVVKYESRTEDNPIPYGDVPSSDASEAVAITLGKLFDSDRNDGYKNWTVEFDLGATYGDPIIKIEFMRSAVHKKAGNLESGFSISWYVVDVEGTRLGPENIKEAQKNNSRNSTPIMNILEGEEDSSEEDRFQPVTRWFNILQNFYSVTGMELKSIWELVRKEKVQWLLNKTTISCDSYPYQGKMFAKSNLQDDEIKDLLDDLDKADVYNDTATLSKEALSTAVWEEGFRMFSFISYCPSDDMKGWTKFYKDTVGQSPPRAILQKVAHIFNRKVMNGDDTRTESAVYLAMSKFFPFKAGNATVGLSSKEELLKNIDSPLLSPLKGSLVGSRVVQFPMNCLQVNCIDKNSCEDAEKAINLVSNLEYEQV